MRRDDNLLVLCLFHHFHIGCIALSCIPNLFLLAQSLEMSWRRCTTLQYGNAFVGGRREGGAIPWVKLQGDLLVKVFVVKVDPPQSSIDTCQPTIASLP
jgi:hypothetical protein